MHVFVVAT